jgi:hypothetical protein
MGLCLSLCPKPPRPNVETRALPLELNADADSSSDPSLKVKSSSQRDSTPLLNGPTLLAFRNLSLDSSSDSIDLEKDQLDAMIKAAAATPTDGSAEPRERTFKDVRPDLDLGNLPSSDSEGA